MADKEDRVPPILEYEEEELEDLIRKIDVSDQLAMICILAQTREKETDEKLIAKIDKVIEVTVGIIKKDYGV